MVSEQINHMYSTIPSLAVVGWRSAPCHVFTYIYGDLERLELEFIHLTFAEECIKLERQLIYLIFTYKHHKKKLVSKYFYMPSMQLKLMSQL